MGASPPRNIVICRSRLPRITHLRDSLPTRDRPIASCSASGSGTRGAGSLLLLLLDELALDRDMNLLADDQPAIENHVKRQAVVLPVDPTLGAVADAVAHIGIIEFP